MDPEIMRFLEEDEDETMHSGADVDAFTAALNRDIEGQSPTAWQPAINNINTDQNHQEPVGTQPVQHSSQVELNKPEPGSDNQQKEDNTSHCQASGQYDQPPPKYICQDILQAPHEMDSQFHDKTPMDIDGVGGKENKENESEKLKLESAINQHALTTGTRNNPGAIETSNLQAPARGMNGQQAISPVIKNQQTITTGRGNHQLLATTMSRQQLAGSGVNIQQLSRQSMLQQSPASGMINQQSIVTGMDNQRSGAMGINNQQTIAMGISNQQSLGMGMNNQQALAIGVNKQSSMAMRSSNQQPLGVGIHNQQLVTSGMSNQPVFNSGLRHQQAMSVGVANQQANLMSRGKQAPFPKLLPIIIPLLDRDKGMQLQTLYQKLKGNEITKEAFVRNMRAIVGDQLLKVGVIKFQQQEKDGAAQQHMQGPSNVQVPVESSDSTLDNNSLQSYEVGRQGDSHNMQKTQMSSFYFSASSQEREHPTYPVQGLNKKQQQHLHFPQTSFSTIGGTGNNHRPFSTSNVTKPAASLKQAHDSQMRQLPVHRNVSRPHLGTPSQAVNMVNAPISASTSQLDHNIPLNPRVPSAPSPVAAENSAKTLIKKPSVGQKKPLEDVGSSPPPSSKKQKVSGVAFLDQSIEHLNDVTAVSGVNLREEEEQLFSGPKEDNRVSEASRRVVQEEEDRLLLQKNPLQKKLAEIMAKSGLKSIGSDVEKCLSLCVEERMRGLMSSLIRMSKQRVDIEKPRHRTFITTDVRKKILKINQKVRVEWEKKLAEEEKLQRLDEPEGSDGDKEKDESRARPVKLVANKEEDEKMRTTATNVAARAAVGGDDMLLKWKLMAELSRQEREGRTDEVPGSQASKDVSQRTSTDGKSVRDHQEAEKRSQLSSTPGSIRKLGRNQVIMAQNRVARAVSVKDVIAVLEREPQMLRSTLIYRLYDKIRSESSAE